MSAKDKDDLSAVNDDLHTYIIKVEVGDEDDDEDLVPLVDPLAPSSNLIVRYETRKRHTKRMLYEGSDKGRDWETEEMEPKEKSSASNPGKSGCEQMKVGWKQKEGSHKMQKSAKSAETRKCGQELKEHSKTDNGIHDGVTVTAESLERTASQLGKDVTRKRRSKQMTDDDRAERHPENRRRRPRPQKLNTARSEVTGETELDARCSGGQRSQQTPEQKADHNRKASIDLPLKNAALTEEQKNAASIALHKKAIDDGEGRVCGICFRYFKHPHAKYKHQREICFPLNGIKLHEPKKYKRVLHCWVETCTFSAGGFHSLEKHIKSRNCPKKSPEEMEKEKVCGACGQVFSRKANKLRHEVLCNSRRPVDLSGGVNVPVNEVCRSSSLVPS